jgi:hypothetical protein
MVKSGAGHPDRTRLALLMALALSACSESSDPRPEPPDVRAWVAGEAAENLDERGRFRLPTARPKIDGPTITADDAARLATAWARRQTSYKDLPRNFRGARLSHYEIGHGDLIDFKALRPGPRAYLAESPYEVVPATWPEHVAQLFEPTYLVPLYSARGFQTLVAKVRARDTGHRVANDGQLQHGPIGSLPFSLTAVPAGAEYDVPLNPECAVRVVAEATGRLVVRVPELVKAGHRDHPISSLWRLTLDAPVSLVGDSTKRADTTRLVYVRSDRRGWIQPPQIEPAWYRALPSPRTADTLEFWAPTDRSRADGPRDRQLYVARMREGYAVRFERVRPPKNAAVGPLRDHFPCELRPRAADSRWAGFGR